MATAAPAPVAVLGADDLHVHTTMSDGDLTLQEVVALARERGVRVGIADHVSTRNRSLFVSTVDGLRAYLDALDGVPVYRSAEFCWCDTLWAEVPGELMQRFDYRLGSNHGFVLPNGQMASPWWQRLPRPWDERPHELMDHFVDNLCTMVRSMPIEIAAHSTFIPPALYALEPDVGAWWTDEREDRYVEALREAGVALEISNRYQLPHERLLRKARQAGVRFTLGSDGHAHHQIARLDWAVEAAGRAGITAGDLYVPQRTIGPAER
jgi:histidinol phosphatase-like PHP family hydrolase